MGRGVRVDCEAYDVGLEDESIIALTCGDDLTERNKAMKKLLRRVIVGELTDKQRRIVYRYYYKEMSLKEIAEVEGMTFQGVAASLSAAKTKIKHVMQYWF